MAGLQREYLLHLADNALVLGQRNAEWCGHGPIIEEDLALGNMSLDLIGQARLLYSHVAEASASGATEDTLAYLRDAPQFRNYTLVELPHRVMALPTSSGDRDFGLTIVRNFLYSALMVLVWEALRGSQDAQLAAIAAKSIKEANYHLRHSRDWLVRLGDGTDESKRRAQAALDYLLPYTQEFWSDSAMETSAARCGVGVDMASLRGRWDALLDATLEEATLRRPAAGGYLSSGKHGVHSEHLGFVLAEMQSLARQHPGAEW